MESHVPPAWQPVAVHVTGLLPMQTPLLHWSVWVHASPSSHAVPLLAAGFEHWPVVGLQVPATWHASSAVHATGLDGVQAPP